MMDQDHKLELETDTSERTGILNGCFEWLEALVTSLAVLSLVFTFLFRVVVVSGMSMQPTLYGNDRVLLANFMYEPQCGDIVVITHSGSLHKPMIKRVIAVENQTVRIDFEKGKVYVDGREINEPYVATTPPFDKEDMTDSEITIPEGYLFVMGDNRNASTDSRSKLIGLVDKKNVLGKAHFIVFPFSRIGSPYHIG